MTLDYKSSIPLHIQLKDIIEDKIAKEVYTGQIPSERQFMEEFNVSRSTVREAINILVREGILEKRHGKGTFVSIKPIQEWLGNLSSTTETILQMGYKPGAKLVEHHKETPPEYVQQRAGFDEAYFIKRVRYADDIPIGIEWHYYPVPIGEKLIQYDLDDATLYDLMQHELGITFAEAEQTITCGPLLEEDRPYLDMLEDHDIPYMLIAERVIKNQEGQIIELEKAYYRSDMYRFQINLSRKFG